MLKIKKAFTLAEMMVVMLILSIVLAAMAPVMTTRSRSDNSSPWRFSPNLSDAYFGAGDKQVALIGQQAVSEDGSDSDSKLLLNSSANTPKHILFKRAGTILGYLFMKDSNIALGNTEMNIANITGTDNIAIGAQTLANVTTGSNNVAVGADALSSSTTSSWNVAIGKNAFHNGTDGSNTIIGGDAMSQGTGANNVALGTNALYYGEGNGNVALGVNANHKTATLTTFTNSTAVGYAAYASGENSTAMGYTSNSTGSSSVSLGDSSIASEENAISIGHSSNASGSNSIAIGGSKSSTEITQATAENSIAIGTNSSAGDIRTIAIGPSAKSNTESAIAIGEGAIVKTTGSSDPNTSSIAIGKNAQITGATCAFGICTRGNSVVIGSDSSTSYSDSILIGHEITGVGGKGIAIGLRSNAASHSIAIGEGACEYVTGSGKVCIGRFSGPASGSKWATDDKERIFIGGQSKFNNKTAVLEVHNTTETTKTGAWIYGGMNASGVVINGSLIVRGPIFAASRDNNVNSWNHAYSTTLGALEHYGSEPNNSVGDHYIVSRMPNDYINQPENFHPSLYNSSDRRLKYVGKESNSGLDKIRQLKVYNYTFKKDKHKTPHVGVIAQDLQKIFPEAVKKAKNGFLTIRMEDMFYAMINAIKELDTRITALEKENQELKTIIKSQDARLKALEAKVK